MSFWRGPISGQPKKIDVSKYTSVITGQTKKKLETVQKLLINFDKTP